MALTTDKNDPCLKNGQKEEGQNNCYLVLSEEERAKGFVRNVRTAYVHVGQKIAEGTIQSLEEGLEGFSDFSKQNYTKEKGYVAFLKFTDGYRSLGKFIKQPELDAFNAKKEYFGGCGTLTTMGGALAETYARDPKFYSATFCCGCNKHLPVGEFIWDGTKEVVGS